MARPRTVASIVAGETPRAQPRSIRRVSTETGSKPIPDGLVSKFLRPVQAPAIAPQRNPTGKQDSYYADAQHIKPPSSARVPVVKCPPVIPGPIGTKTQTANALGKPGWQVFTAYRSAQNSLARAQEKFPRNVLHNGPGDAWRHFRWNYSMAKTMGAPAAQDFANAHEVSSPNEPAESAMDLHNNAMGRAFGIDPKYAKLSADAAADMALRSGCLIPWAKPRGR